MIFSTVNPKEYKYFSNSLGKVKNVLVFPPTTFTNDNTSALTYCLHKTCCNISCLSRSSFLLIVLISVLYSERVFIKSNSPVKSL